MKYIGVDAHSSTCEFSVVNGKGEVLEQATIVSNGRLLVDYIRSIEGNKRMTFEECELSHWLYGLFKKEVNEIIVCDPVANKEYKGAKTDKLDANRLAKLLRGNFLSAVYHDDSPREKFRVLMSGYQDLVIEAVRFKNRYKSLFRKSGKRVSGETVFGDENLLEDLELKGHRFVGERVLRIIERLEEERALYVKEIRRMNRKFPEIKYLKSIPGIKDIRAAQIVCQVVDPGRFRSKYKYYSYCGLVSHRRQSGGKEYGKKRIYGNRTLKCVYKMAGNQVLRGESGLRKYYDKLRTKGVGDRSARNAVCRKIAAISLSLWKNKQEYDDKLLSKDISS